MIIMNSYEILWDIMRYHGYFIASKSWYKHRYSASSNKSCTGPRDDCSCQPQECQGAMLSTECPPKRQPQRITFWVAPEPFSFRRKLRRQVQYSVCVCMKMVSLNVLKTLLFRFRKGMALGAHNFDA